MSVLQLTVVLLSAGHQTLISLNRPCITRQPNLSLTRSWREKKWDSGRLIAGRMPTHRPGYFQRD